MDAFKPKHTRKDGPESGIQVSIEMMLRGYGWLTVATYGSIHQCGLPDLYATNSRYGARWIEVKNPDAYRFTAAQLDLFPKLCANGAGVWILIAANEWEYKKLFRPYNWHEYLK